jgi:hypothetical protein
MATKLILTTGAEAVVGVLVPPNGVLVERADGSVAVISLDGLADDVAVQEVAPCELEPYPVDVAIQIGRPTAPGLWWPSESLVAVAVDGPPRVDRPTRPPLLVHEDDVVFRSVCEREEEGEKRGPSPLLIGLGMLVAVRLLRGKK